MKKINWRNVIKSITFVFCIGVILHDIWLVGFSYLFTGASCSFTWYGLITFIFMLIISDFIYEDFKNQIKSIQSNRPKYTKDTCK